MNGLFTQTLLLGLKSLLLQKMRSALAALGIFIGTTTVIWLVAMGEGVSYEAQQQIMELGAKNIIVRSVEPQSADAASERVKTYGLLRKDFQRILTNVPSISSAVPMRELKREFLVDGRTADVNLVGCTVLGLLIGLEVPRSTRLLLGTGLCGGLTTFSTFTVEAAQMMRADDTTLAVAYVLCSMAGGLAAVVVGRAAGARIGNPRC